MSEKQKHATHICRVLQDAGHTALFAGGWVRDYLMQHPSDDIDIATDASTDQVQALFEKTIPVGVAFGIVIVVIEGDQFEVATFRKDRGYTDGRRPTGIDPATPEEDAQRRDFTINGMFYDPIDGTVFDFVNGRSDLQAKIIRAIGDPHERFFEDRLRMMRAIRYSTRFDFPIEEATLNAIAAHSADLLPAVAMERIWQEFKKMSRFAHFDTGLLLLHELGLLPTIFPDLKEIPLSEIEQRIRYIECFPKGSPTFAELLELFPDYDLDQINTLAEILKLSNEEKAFASFYFHAKTLFQMPSEWLEKLEPYEWAQFYADPHAAIGLSMLAAKRPDGDAFLSRETARQNELKDAITMIQTKSPPLRAKHLIDLGISPSPHLGALLEEGTRLAINHSLTTPEEILILLKNSPYWLK